MAPAVSLRQWPCTMESSGSAGQQSRPPSLGRRPGHGPTRDLEMSGGLSSIFHRVAVFESFRKQNQSNDARLSATHSYMSDLPPLVWSRIDITTLAPRPSTLVPRLSQTKGARRRLDPTRTPHSHASLDKLAGKGANLVELGRGCHTVALGHTADGNDALVFPVAIRA